MLGEEGMGRLSQLNQTASRVGDHPKLQVKNRTVDLKRGKERQESMHSSMDFSTLIRGNLDLETIDASESGD